MIVKGEVTPSSICTTPCPYVDGTRIASMACEQCVCFFGYKDSGVRCTGKAIFNGDTREA